MPTTQTSRDQCLTDLFQEAVEAHPHRTAVVDEEESLTYRELAERSTDLAAYLRHLGVAPDDRVGIFVEPSIELMAGVWGILFASGAYLPLSPEYPEARLRYMIEDARVDVVVAQEKLTPRLAELAPKGTTIVTVPDVLEFAGSPAAGAARRALGTGPRPHDLAYVIYTSGSTGKPKGVMIEHRAIVNQMRWMKAVCNLDRDAVVLQKTPMSFDAAQWEILAPSCGSEVVMGRPGVYRDPEGLIEAIGTHRVTTLQCVPTLLQALLDTDGFARLTSLTQIFSGGEALSKNLARQCLETFPKCELVNLYGPTECTINTSAFAVDRDGVDGGSHMIPIGTPVHHTHYRILDAHRAPVAAGETGELYIGGAQLARGYLHRPELTAQRFIDDPFRTDDPGARLYRTGDLAYRNADGTVQFAGRADNQVKLRGFRVELDEIRLAIENHDWVKNAAVVVKDDPRTGFQNLIACIELSPKEAALMDQGRHGAHHQSKASRLQVKAQLANGGCRDAADLRGRTAVELPGAVPTPEQRRKVFARKTYRFFEGGDVEKADILRLLGGGGTAAAPRDPAGLTLAEWGEILRWFGQYLSAERLLPKYGYASPGSLYATQLYLELNGVGGVRPGCYYYHPVHHRLVLMRETDGTEPARVKLHFVGRKSAIEPVYKNNIEEVLEIETGHMIGLFEEVLPAYGLDVRALGRTPAVKDGLGCADEDYALGTFEVVAYDATRADEDALEIYVQTHPGKVADMPTGLYRYAGGDLERISDEIVLKKHVIAINQRVHERSALGITVVNRDRRGWRGYIDLGRKLQRLQMNDIGLGFMSSGYSSRSGDDLPSARRMEAILTGLGLDTGASYFFVGGRVSEEQTRSEGMKEDLVHMKGPAELIKDDLINFLPDYMLPNRVVVMDRLPLTANGKIDVKALAASEKVNTEAATRPFVAPRTKTEERISRIWRKVMKRDAVSVRDDFFESGGNSLMAVALINTLNKECASALPLQILFENPTVEELARRVDGASSVSSAASSRLVRLWGEGDKPPVHCWPGLGGYAMNLRPLAAAVDIDRPFYGVQSHGINEGETPYPTIKEMAGADVTAVKRLQPEGPYTLWGYSFGARVAFETAYRLEQAGDRVENLFLIAPGSPKFRAEYELAHGGEPTYRNKAFVAILFSVFAGRATGPALEDCLRATEDEESFLSFIGARFADLDQALIKRIVEVVRRTYEFKYSFDELTERRIDAPVTVFRAAGDDYSFIENASGYASAAPRFVDLAADHYGLLRDPGVNELVRAIRRRLGADGV
ncbi:amino acid adenylation domain-containing protein [Streptomyces syringium]|uniref:amino acid adenylation domain-containing protein n=1 Tax=Streptomyces syringium TaxID=76729 RepID=UPI00343EA698